MIILLIDKYIKEIMSEALVKQIGYYLSDANLQIDEFFYEKVAADKYIFLTQRSLCRY